MRCIDPGNTLRRHGHALLSAAALSASLVAPAYPATLDANVIGEASGATASVMPDGVVRIGWMRTDVAVVVDGMGLPPAAGLASWAAFAPMRIGALLMGDTVVFEDEVDAAMDAAFASGLSVTAIHNHFFHDTPRVYFMHISGRGSSRSLAAGVGSVWAAIRGVRTARLLPATSFGGPVPAAGRINAAAISNLIGQPAVDVQGVAKVTIGRSTTMQGLAAGASMGVTTWAAFSGTDELAAIDGDFAMTSAEVQPVLRALRRSGIHVVALHSHMTGEHPGLYFAHFWATGKAEDLAKGLRRALDAQSAVKMRKAHSIASLPD